MEILFNELSAIAKQKSALLRSEAGLWDKIAQALTDWASKASKQNDIWHSPRVTETAIDKPAYGILRLPEVIRNTGLSRSSIYKLMNENRFPPSIELGARSVGWLEKDVEHWIMDKTKKV